MTPYDVSVTTAGRKTYAYQVDAQTAEAARLAAAARFVHEQRFETSGAILSGASTGFAPEPSAGPAGPLCDSMEWQGHCVHASCQVLDDTLPDLGDCPQHGGQEITGGDTFTGYAGGRCWVLHLACGCSIADESGDVAAAL